MIAVVVVVVAVGLHLLQQLLQERFRQRCSDVYDVIRRSRRVTKATVAHHKLGGWEGVMRLFCGYNIRG